LVTPTELEARNEIRDESSGLAVVAQKIRALLEIEYVLVKLGADGVLLAGIDEQGKIIRTDLVPALNKNPVDVSGAGDSMLAGTALTLASGYSIYIAAYIGSIMSAIQVSRSGNIPISKDEFKSLFV
jgi:sugar/nucleoside kinase (ribokinase family)